ncbi:MAG: mycothiol conjugate amidase Mca [Sporichthyaceae bacterium]
MAVHAHPDDESSKGAATMARYVSEGAEVLVVTCTGGERGDVLNPRLKDDPEIAANILAIRAAEMEAARVILGVSQVWLGFEDSGFPDGDPKPPLPEGCFALVPTEVAAAPLVALIREFRPHVITTYNELGGYPHPDHLATHQITVAAFDAAGDPDLYPEAGPVWQPLKLYYDVGFSMEKFEALHAAMVDEGLESPFVEWMERFHGRPARPITTRVPCGEFFPVRDAALIAHATQIDPDGFFFRMPMALQQAAWPTEDFELARSMVDSELPEDDLFAGVRETLGATEVSS